MMKGCSLVTGGKWLVTPLRGRLGSHDSMWWR